MEEATIYCKIEEVTMTGTGEGVIFFSKEKTDTLQESLRILKEKFEGKDVMIIILPFRRKDNEDKQAGS